MEKIEIRGDAECVAVFDKGIKSLYLLIKVEGKFYSLPHSPDSLRIRLGEDAMRVVVADVQLTDIELIVPDNILTR